MNTQTKQTKVIMPGKSKTWGGRTCYVFCKIEWDGERLSISGVEGPLPSGNALGSCGQIREYLLEYEPAQAWNKSMLLQLYDVWGTYHLNDMQSACEHQRTRGLTYNTHRGDICPECGYEIGTAWLTMTVPQSVIDWLFALPSAPVTPAWV